MNARVLGFPIAGVCIAALLAACGNVAQGIMFQPPAGWTGTPAMFGRFQLWMKSGQDKDSTQILMLIKGDAKNMHADFSSIPSQYSNDVKVVHQGPTKLCGGAQPAEEFVGRGTDKNGKHSEVEMISSVVGADRYVAMYIRPQSMPADAQAETAIHSLCPLKQ